MIPGNVAALAFWRRIISELTKGDFSEVEVKSGWWQGTVQQFAAPTAA